MIIHKFRVNQILNLKNVIRANQINKYKMKHFKFLQCINNLLLQKELISKETKMEMIIMMNLIKLKIGEIIEKKLLLKLGLTLRISFHNLEEALVETHRNLLVLIVKNSLRLNQMEKKNGNQFRRVKDIVIQNFLLVLKTLETVSTFIFNLICYIYSLLFCIIDASPIPFAKYPTKDT